MLSPVQQRFDDFRHQSRSQAGSLIISIFGDAIMPRGNRIWLGSLIRLLATLDINERLIRTSVFRLTKEAWLCAEPCGRRSNYTLTPSGQRRFKKAANTIYAASAAQWDYRWRLIIPVGELTIKERDKLRRALFWQGFGALRNDCFIHPGADLDETFDALIAEDLSGVLDRLKPLIAADFQLGGAASSQDMAHKAWDLQQLADVYAAFVTCYQPILDQLRDDADSVDDESAFLLRVLLIHDYRRLLLRDPALPNELLPANWPGQQARILCKDIYRRLLDASERYLEENFQLAHGPIPPASADLAERFREIDPLLIR